MRLSRAINFSSRTVPPSTTVKRGFIVKEAEVGVEVEDEVEDEALVFPCEEEREAEVELEAVKVDENILAK